MESSIITQVQKEDIQLSPKTGQVSRSSPKKPRSCNLFKALFCCLRGAQAAPKPLQPSQDALLEPQDNGDVVKLSSGPSLLPEMITQDQGKICVVIDLDETLVHSSFKPISNADFIVPVEIEGTTHQVYVLKRPYVDEFLQRMGELFECILFTASLAKPFPHVLDDLCSAKTCFVNLHIKELAYIFNVTCSYFCGQLYWHPCTIQFKKIKISLCSHFKVKTKWPGLKYK
ncbi:carboxy-terminal domain RNA polymerase II polypeptide A small phosphatase 2 isoform X2 [Oncorhynchus tshawytscha]|uniref:carboxy-terminal domain RNA polymerase II polypeptide A small phosphatase 2 isoform X2 n=1 Tax=Oncorhynchus tshawytscha TaxID=74940 RepID=UPI000D0987D9|nr:carboxy-terminal domain RNA polymerase II polypeptide A small phosphatase 2 isoform X2 [Oncorhynchus tshawytscha]